MLNFLSTSLSSPFPPHWKEMGTGVWFSAATAQLLGFQIQRHWPSYTFFVACDGRATLTADSPVQHQNLTGLWRRGLSNGINMKNQIVERCDCQRQRRKNKTVEPVSAFHPHVLRVRTHDGRMGWTGSDTCAREESKPHEHPALAPAQRHKILTRTLSIDNHTCNHFGLISLGGIT